MNMAIPYIIASMLFIFAIRGLSSPKTARQGNILGMTGMAIAIITTLFLPQVEEFKWVIGAILAGAVVGIFMALRVKLTSLPQMVAMLNGLGGLSSVFVALAEIVHGSSSYLESSIGLIIGALAFSGSMIAYAKLEGIMKSNPLTFPLQQILHLILGIVLIGVTVMFTITGDPVYFYTLAAISILLGFLLILPIGGADMPVVIAVLNAYSGLAGVGIGFSLGNTFLIIVGSLVGASGIILSYIMCKAMNRSLLNVMLGGFGNEVSSAQCAANNGDKTARAGSPEDAAFIMENSSKVIIVPGYGMAVAQAQNILQDMAQALKAKGVEVKYAIHPVAGRMPGHMNVLLAEANVDYDDVFELSEINHEFATADVAFVIGANDVTNPLAKTDPSSPIYGMPVLDVENAKNVFFVKRSLASGYSGVDNPLFYADNTTMLYGDAKKVTELVVAALDS